jgi:hypothetical protein
MDKRVEIKQLPMYATYPRFLGLVDQYKTSGIPPHVVARQMGDTPLTIAYRLVAGMRFLGLLDDAGTPTQVFRNLVAARGTPDWQNTLRAIIESAYAFLAPTYATGGRTTPGLQTAFEQYAGRKDSAIKAATTFFLAAAADAGMPIDVALLGRVRQSSFQKSPPKRAVPLIAAALTTATRPVAYDSGPPKEKPDRLGELLARLPPFDAKWSDDLKRIWFENYSRLVGGAIKS